MAIRTLALFVLIIFTGCAETKFDYTAFKKSNPGSILVLPPINQSLEVVAGAAIMASSLKPIGEAGYYVFPPTLVYEVFKENGVTEPSEIHDISLEKLRSVFNPDAVLYITITDYGQKYFVLGSASVVTLSGRLVDAKTGTEIWSGLATANSKEGQAAAGGGVAGLLIQALADQIAGQLLDLSYSTSKMASERLLSPELKNNLLYGPRHPKAGKAGP